MLSLMLWISSYYLSMYFELFLYLLWLCFLYLKGSLSDSVWSPFSTCTLLLSICILFFNVSGMVVYVIFLFISVYVQSINQSINQSIEHYIFHCPKNLQDYLGNNVKFLKWEDNELLSKIWICNLQWKMLDWDSRDDIINS